MSPDPTPAPFRLPVAAPDLDGNEERYVVEALRSSWISSTGSFVTRFEREFAEACGTRAAISVSNGSVALHLALLALDVRAGDEVIVPSLTFVSTANACVHAGAQPVFADVDPDTWCLDPRRLAEALTPRTRGIIAVHLYGHPADMDAINAFAAAHGLWVVEDAAEAPLARYKGRTTGGLGRIGTFSFYGNKVFTAGEGGAVTLDDPELERRARLFRGQGQDPARRYFFPVVGHNFRLTNIACALLCAQFERRDEILARRRAVTARYAERLDGMPGLAMQPRAAWAECSPWMFSVVVEPGFGRTRDGLAAALAGAGIETRPLFIPLHTLPPYGEDAARRGAHLPETDRLGARGLSLPTFSGLGRDDIDEICDRVIAARA